MLSESVGRAELPVGPALVPQFPQVLCQPAAVMAWVPPPSSRSAVTIINHRSFPFPHPSQPKSR